MLEGKVDIYWYYDWLRVDTFVGRHYSDDERRALRSLESFIDICNYLRITITGDRF